MVISGKKTISLPKNNNFIDYLICKMIENNKAPTPTETKSIEDIIAKNNINDLISGVEETLLSTLHSKADYLYPTYEISRVLIHLKKLKPLPSP